MSSLLYYSLGRLFHVRAGMVLSYWVSLPVCSRVKAYCGYLKRVAMGFPHQWNSSPYTNTQRRSTQIDKRFSSPYNEWGSSQKDKVNPNGCIADELWYLLFYVSQPSSIPISPAKMRTLWLAHPNNESWILMTTNCRLTNQGTRSLGWESPSTVRVYSPCLRVLRNNYNWLPSARCVGVIVQF